MMFLIKLCIGVLLIAITILALAAITLWILEVIDEIKEYF
jgi:hypothetical protein